MAPAKLITVCTSTVLSIFQIWVSIEILKGILLCILWFCDPPSLCSSSMGNVMQKFFLNRLFSDPSRYQSLEMTWWPSLAFLTSACVSPQPTVPLVALRLSWVDQQGDSWWAAWCDRRQNDFRQMVLNGLFRETYKGCSLDVQSPGINAISELAVANRFWMSSVQCAWKESITRSAFLRWVCLIQTCLIHFFIRSPSIHPFSCTHTIQSL